MQNSNGSGTPADTMFSRRHLTSTAGAALLAASIPWSPGQATAAPNEEPSASPAKPARKPNFLVIVADDLGFSDLGCYGSEIRTPHLDALAKAGLRLSDFHVAPACSPTRVMLMTGVDHHKAGIGSMLEVVYPGFKGAPGYEGHINDRVVALPELLRDGGYRTIMSGKWHLGEDAKSFPAARGFDRSFCLLPAGADHYADGVFRKMLNAKPIYAEGTKLVHDLPKDFYSSDYFTDRMIGFLEEDKDQPFFAYLAYSAPHWPLHAPREDIERYRGRYADGPDALREHRLAGLKRAGIVAQDVVPHPMETDQPQWADMTPEAKALSSRTMEVYAAMVDRMDQNIGRLVSYLKTTGRFDDTVILFMSDNGAEGAIAEAYPILGPVFTKVIGEYGDNSLDNIGLPNSCIWYGPRWAQAATAPLRLMKSYTTEGGIRVPAFITGPGLTRNGDVSDSFATVMDIAPTLLEMAGLSHPGNSYKGKPVHALQGRSLAPWLARRSEAPHPPGTTTGWELFGRRAIRKDGWKLTYTPNAVGKGQWELFDLSSDPGETNDLTTTHPQKVKELLALWEDYVRENGVLVDLPTIYQGDTSLWAQH